jgi:hypothetical protein
VTRITARFESRASLLEGIEAARRGGVRVVSTVLPAYDAELVGAIGVHPRTGPVASAAAIAGGAGALWFTTWTARQWPLLVVSGKPLLSWSTFVIVAFEMAVLCAALAAVAAFLVRLVRAHRAVRGYDLRPDDAPFALLIACAPERVDHVKAMLQEHGALTCQLA